jgi:UDPglucose 6-dehydrogenase
MTEAKALLKDVVWCEDTYAALQGAHAALFLTEWNQFRALDLDRVKACLRAPIIVDLRNMYVPADMAARGFDYRSIGRGRVPPK